ncbi:MAG TPA: serine hydrolase [Candidatus Limnocylindrales bacterium]|nr:serine hydrolase [Candidatus Limnocylindrales bacterium]
MRKTPAFVLPPLIACLLVIAAAPAPTRIAPAPAPTRPAALEQRIRAIVAKSHGVWGVSVRHIERHQSAGIRENERFPMASVFKVPILVELFHQVWQGKIALGERVEWKNPGIYFGSGILAAMQPGLKPTVHDLATLMIIVSDNAATDQILARVGKANVNARMRALGLTKTSVDASTREHTLESFGLRDPKYKDFTPADFVKFDFQRHETEIVRNQKQALRDCHNCSTPSEMSQLLEKIATGQAGDAVATIEMLSILSKQQFNMRLPRFLPVGIRVAHKTGTVTNPVLVVNDAGIIFLPNGEHVVVTVFGHGTDMNQDDVKLKAALNEAEDTIAEIGRVVFEYYTGSHGEGAQPAR